MPDQESMLKKRLGEMKLNFNNLVQLETLYYNVAYDIGFLNDGIIDYLKYIQACKTEIKSTTRSIAEFEREFELTEEFLTLKSYKYQIKGLERMMSGIKIRIESMRAEKKGQY